MTNEMEPPEDANNEEPAADETSKVAVRKSVKGDTDEIAVQGYIPTETAPDHNLRETAGRGWFRYIELFKNLLRETAARGGVAANDDMEKMRKLNREIYDERK